MNKKLLFGVVIVILTTAFTVYKAINWKVKEDYSVRVFQGGDHFVSFKGLKADISFDEEHPENSKISASVESGSIDADHNEAMKNGAKQPDVLDIEKFPTISFISTSVIKKDSIATGPFKMSLFLPGESPKFNYIASGKLTLKGITKEIKLLFKFENQVFKGGFTIDPKDFNIMSENFQKQLNIVLYVPVVK